jgi:SAM-dependent methyltransferase
MTVRGATRPAGACRRPVGIHPGLRITGCRRDSEQARIGGPGVRSAWPGAGEAYQAVTVTFEELVAEGADVPVEGWDFSWFEGRATEQRPSWGYAAMLAERVGRVASVVDLQTGGGEVFDWVLRRATRRPETIAATESWSPNVTVAAGRLAEHSALLVRAADGGGLPLRSASFELAASRHPVTTVWPEIARVLRPGGVFLSQQVGPGSNRELYEFLMGPQPLNRNREPTRAVVDAEEAGLEVTDLRQESLETVFFDVAAVVHFLRKVPWTVPDFTIDRYRDRLGELHGQIQQRGHFLAHAERYLIEARRPEVAHLWTSPHPPS